MTDSSVQVMEHLRSTKASVADLQDVKDLLHTKAGIKDVNITLTQASLAQMLAFLQTLRCANLILFQLFLRYGSIKSH